MKRLHYLLIPVAIVGLVGAGCRHKDRSEYVLKKMDRRVSKLDLNETQKKHYQEVRAKVAVELKKQFQTRGTVRETLRGEFRKSDPDVRAVSAEMQKLIRDRGDSLAKLPEYFADFYEKLDAKQKAKVIEKFRDRLDL